MRAISTVLDVSLCLLLVAASAMTLASTPLASESDARGGPDTADETAELLATSTARVTYDAGNQTRETRTRRVHTWRNRTRTVHDTLAGLLASAVLADASTADAFVAAVTTRVGRTLRRLDRGVQVVARPTTVESNAARDGRVVAGDEPPPSVDVHAATFAVRGVRLTVRTWSL